MTTQHLTLNHQTRLAVQIIVEDETGVLTYAILVATRLLTLLWHISRYVSAVVNGLSALIGDLRTALDFTGKVLTIGFNALIYGFGLELFGKTL